MAEKKYSITNTCGELRRFATADDRWLTMMGGETERGVQLTDHGVETLRTTGEFVVRPESEPSPAPASKESED
jgi:hypothetical protein